MGTVAVVFADPEAEVVAALETTLGEVVSTKYPSTGLALAEFRVQVELETGTADAYPVSEVAQVRVVVHTAKGKRDDVKRIADDARSVLASWGGNDNVARVGVGPRSGVTSDLATENLMCWFLARVVLKGRRRTP